MDIACTSLVEEPRPLPPVRAQHTATTPALAPSPPRTMNLQVWWRREWGAADGSWTSTDAHREKERVDSVCVCVCVSCQVVNDGASVLAIERRGGVRHLRHNPTSSLHCNHGSMEPLNVHTVIQCGVCLARTTKAVRGRASGSSWAVSVDFTACR